MNIGPSSESSPSPSAPEQSSPTAVAEQILETPTENNESASGPLASVIRGKGPLAARGLGIAKPASPAGRPMPAPASAASPTPGDSGATSSSPARDSKPAKKNDAPRPRLAGQSDADVVGGTKPLAPERSSKVAVPNLRQDLSDDLLAELERELAGTAVDVDGFLGGSAGMANRKGSIEDGQRVSGVILKIHHDDVFVGLGGPDEGVVALANFTNEEPKVGDAVEVISRGMNRADGLYVLTLPGEALDVSDWEDIDDGTVVEATITGSNAGGLECTVANIRGFIPISQISEHRVEDTAEFVGQKMICVVTESNQRRGNLVLSHRAIMERERQERKREQLEQIEPGDLMEGTVRTIKDFGAFVDLGGLEGLIHISKLSWDRIKHPSEVLEVGQKVSVRIDTVDKQTGKLSLSYRDTLENPWDAFANSVSAGTIMAGMVTRIANFGAFVRLAAGVEGLIHISEVANHRVSNVGAFLNEGQEVEVKLLSIDRDAQKISLSMKQVHAIADESVTQTEDVAEPLREPIVKATHSGPLRGGNDRAAGGEKFGLRW